MLRILDVPSKFLPKMTMRYPPHHDTNNPMTEELCYNYLVKNYKTLNIDHIYIPIQWTALHLQNNWGNDTREVTAFCQNLNEKYPNEKFFTVVQWDGGTLVPINNCNIFACSGNFNSQIGKNSIYEPIPLKVDPHPTYSNKKYKVGYCGRSTHDIRKKMIDLLSNIDEEFKIYDTDTNHMTDVHFKIFRDILNESIFSLCPRGYGPTSFRLYESIQVGSIPIIISDVDWLPFKQYINWNKLSVIVDPKDIKNIPKIVDELIDSKEYIKMLEYGKYCYNEYFSEEGIAKTLVKIIQEK
jgi:hypothetical protein